MKSRTPPGIRGLQETDTGPPHPDSSLPVALSASHRPGPARRSPARREGRKRLRRGPGTRRRENIEAFFTAKDAFFQKQSSCCPEGTRGPWRRGRVQRAPPGGRAALSGRGFSGRSDRAPWLPWRLPPSCGPTGCPADTRTEWGLGDGPQAQASCDLPFPAHTPTSGPRGGPVGGSPQDSDTLDSAGGRSQAWLPPSALGPGARRPGTGTWPGTSISSILGTSRPSGRSDPVADGTADLLQGTEGPERLCRALPGPQEYVTERFYSVTRSAG